MLGVLPSMIPHFVLLVVLLSQLKDAPATRSENYMGAFLFTVALPNC